MNKLSNKKTKITLGDDDELHQPLQNLAEIEDALFCVHCSAANLPGAKLCNERGRSLIERQVYASETDDGDKAKLKNDTACCGNYAHDCRLALG